MSPFAILVIAGFLAGLLALAYMLFTEERTGSAAITLALAAGFAAFSAVTIASEGVVQVWSNHVANLWGVQVFWDLILAVLLAFFLMLPRARAAGMAVPLWGLFVIATASIGLFAMAARLFWIESRTAPAAAATT